MPATAAVPTGHRWREAGHLEPQRGGRFVVKEYHPGRDGEPAQLVSLNPDYPGLRGYQHLLARVDLLLLLLELRQHRGLARDRAQLGRDFCFVGSEYPVQVGNQDFAIDLVFFHRGLTCLVAFELKVGKFEPEQLGKHSFDVEALDRDVEKLRRRRLPVLHDVVTSSLGLG